MRNLLRSSKDKVKKIDANLRRYPPFLSIVVLSWNRLDLLRTTVLSLLANTHCPFEMFIIDNNSSEDCTKWIRFISKNHRSIQPIFLDENIGGEAINFGLEEATGSFILISENDLEYLPDWDINMLIPFFCFKALGQISPFSPFPMIEMGEIWSEKAYKSIRIEGLELKVAAQNVGSSSLIRKQIIEAGVRFENLKTRDEFVKFPADAKFSAEIKLRGYWVAWSNEYQVINWGHIENSWQKSSGYYRNNWKAKAQSRIDGLGDYESVLISLEGKNPEEKEAILVTKIGELFQRIEAKSNGVFPQADFGVCSTMFVATDGDFSAYQVSINIVNPYTSHFDLKFDLSDFESIDRLRWDPYEGKECRVNLTSITMTDRLGLETAFSMDLVQHNGEAAPNSNRISFFTTDPMYFFPVTGEFLQCRVQGIWELIEPEASHELFDCRIGKISRGKYKLTLQYDGEINSLGYFNEHPAQLNQFENISIQILERSDHFFTLALNITEDCNEFWIQFECTKGYLGNYELQFGIYSKHELFKIEWCQAIIRHTIKKVLKVVGVKKVTETSRALKPREFSKLLIENQHDVEHQ